MTPAEASEQAKMRQLSRKGAAIVNGVVVGGEAADNRTQILLDLLQTARAERYKMQTEARNARALVKGLEVKLSKIEVQHTADLKAQYHEVKQKFKTKFVQRLSALDSAFKSELKALNAQYNEIKDSNTLKEKIIQHIG